MSNKFERLLDHLVNEDMDKANALFHEIVVEKSRSIYESLMAY
jgi:lipopolysaccharide biosynthesis regulator YciM